MPVHSSLRGNLVNIVPWQGEIWLIRKITWPCQYYVINTCGGLRLDSSPRDVFAVFVTALPLEKESSGSVSVYEISATKHITWFTFSLLFWRQLFGKKLDGRKFLCQFSVQFCVANVILFSYDKEPLMRKTELRARKTFVNKIVSSVHPYENHDP